MAFYILPFTKICSNCESELGLADFYSHRTSRLGVANICKLCSSIKSRKYRLANPEKCKELDRQKRLNKPELYKQLKKDWYKNNLDKVKDLKRTWRTVNIDKIREYHREYSRKWKANNRERLNDQRSKSYHSNLDQNRQKNRERYAKNKEKILETKKKWDQANSEKRKASRKRWLEANRSKYLEYKKQLQHRRRFQKKEGRCDFTVEQWDIIKSFYSNRCAFCNKNEKLTIDHVQALSKGGEHTASNIIPLCMKCNQSKGNRPAKQAFEPHLFMRLNS